MRRRQASFALTTAAALTLAGLPSHARAQTLQGRVLDERSDQPIPGAVVFLVGADGRGRAQAESDSLGRFFLSAPGAGDYALVANRIGYERARTPLLKIERGDLPRIDLLMRAQPIGLEGLDVTVDAAAALRDELMLLGIDMDLFPPRRLVVREEVLARQGSVDLAAILQWQNIPGLTVVRSEDQGTFVASRPPCVRLLRGRRATGGARCALYVVNGVPDRDGTIFWNLPETDVETMVVLLPTEASILYGAAGGGGVVVVFTRGWIK